MDKLLISGQGDNTLLICNATDDCEWNKGFPMGEDIARIVEEGIHHQKMAHPTQSQELLDTAHNLQTVAGNAIEILEERLKSEGASNDTIVAYTNAVEAQSAIEVLCATPEELLGYKTPQQAFFTLLAGPDHEGMGIAMVVRHLAIGLPGNG